MVSANTGFKSCYRLNPLRLGGRWCYENVLIQIGAKRYQMTKTVCKVASGHFVFVWTSGHVILIFVLNSESGTCDGLSFCNIIKA